MGWFGLFTRTPPNYMPVIASVVKLPALFLLTLVVTFPSLYVFNALVGCRLDFAATLRLLIGAVVVNLAVAASLGPILAFFTISTTSYAFMVVLNVILLGVAGVVGLGFLLQTLRRLAAPPTYARPAAPPAPAGADPEGEAAPSPPRESGPLERPPVRHDDEVLGPAHLTFRIWVIIYGLVGAQMGWLLRPFIGNPWQEFTWFRHREGNFFQAVLAQLGHLFGLPR